MRKNILFFFLPILLCGCQTMAKIFLGISMPSPKNQQQIQSCIKKYKLTEFEHLQTTKEGFLQYFQFSENHSTNQEGFQFDPIVFYKNHLIVPTLDTICSAHNINLIKKLIDTTTFKQIDSVQLKDVLNSTNIAHFDSISVHSSIANKDYVVLLYWATFEGFINKQNHKYLTLPLLESIQQQGLNAQVYYVNFDMRKEWEQ